MTVPEAPLPTIPGASRRMVAIETADVGRLELHVLELGDGPPVLMLHGWPQHAGCWRLVAPRLAERHRVICPDLRGFGASDAPGSGYRSPTFAADAVALLDALELERVGLVGHDWGGFSGFLVSLRHPERVAAYLALNTPLPWARLTPRVILNTWRSWYAVMLATPVLGQAVVERGPQLIARLLRHDAVEAGISREEAVQYARSLAKPAQGRATNLLYRSYLRSFVQLPSGGGSGGARRLTVPTRLLFGARDFFITKHLVLGDHADHADDLRVELVEDSGHFIPEERPDLVARRALELFAS
jgi:pimeloyl-ACP methyl ester carboxylesterase